MRCERDPSHWKQSVPLTATATVDIAVKHGPQKRKAIIRPQAVLTPGRLFGGRARDRTVARNYHIRRMAALQGRNNALKLSVSDFPSFIAFSLRGDLQTHCDNFRAGCFLHSSDAWNQLTSHQEILSTVSGTTIK